METIYKGKATGDDGSIALIFINDKMIQGLSECTQIYNDGTFEVCMLYFFKFISFLYLDLYYLYYT